jgi:diguanylate cyclase (GGDEF)-like protein/PAS domain S-box-containing protein
VAGGRPARPFALMYLDLDRFKPVNDTLGHEAGDHVLRIVGDRLSRAAGPDGLVCRFGGDEFTVLVDPADGTEALRVARRMLEVVRLPISGGPGPVRLDASIGVALADAGTGLANPEELTRRADQAMYEAKRAGRGRCRVAPRRPETAPNGNGSAPPGPEVAPEPEAGPEPVGAGRRPGGRPARRTHRRRHRLTPRLPLVVATLLVIGIAAFGTVQSAAARRAAEEQRLGALLQEAAHTASHYARQYDPARMEALSTGMPWALDGSERDQLLVRLFHESPLAGPEGAVVLATPEGRILAAAPADAHPGIPPDSPAWRRAAGGRASAAPNVRDADRGRNYLLLPVLREGRTVAVLAVGGDRHEGYLQKTFEITGSVGSTAGGWSLLDGRGEVVFSWRRDLLDTPLVDPAALGGLRGGQSRATATRAGDLLVVSPLVTYADDPDGRLYLAFSMPADEMYRDLRSGQAVRDLGLALVVLAAVIGLTYLGHRREEDVRRRHRRLDALLEHAHDVTLLLDRHGRPAFVSSAVQGLLGYQPADVVGSDLLDLVHQDDRAAVADALASTGEAFVENVRLRTAGGEHRWFDIVTVDLRVHDEVEGVLVVAHDVSRRKALEEELARQARHDGLTGLPNRAALAEHLRELVGVEPAFALLFVDLDRFKPVNDRLGHDVGDEVLQIIARRFVAAVRDGDRPGERDIVCRWGGDEFAILLRAVQDEADACTVADRVLDAARTPIHVGGHRIRLGATVGIAVSRPDRADPDVLLREADLAMYEAKAAGRNRYALFGVRR